MQKKIMILGGTGLLGKCLIKTCQINKQKYVTAGRNNCDINLDLTNKSLVEEMLHEYPCQIIINATGLTSLLECEENYKKCYQINAKIVDNFINSKLSKNYKFIQISTDQVYKGKENIPNKENSKIKLNNNYAKTKYAAEKICLKNKNSLIIRTNFTGIKKNDIKTFYEWTLDVLKKNKYVNLFDDAFNSTIDVYSASEFILKLALKNAEGIFNLGSSDFISKKEFILKVAKELNLKFENYSTTSIDIIKPKRSKNLGLDITKISDFLKLKMPNSKTVIKNLVRGKIN